MKFDQRVVPYLDGSAFSNGLVIEIGAVADSADRLAYLTHLAQDRSVIHMGCVDHMPLIAGKIANDTWLHGRLARVAKRCLGVDTAYDGVAHMVDVLGYADVVCADVVKSVVPEIESQAWDLMIMGELLEHIDDPVQFLSAIRGRYAARISHLIITVPNAYEWVNIRQAFRGREFINTDHRYWFTPYTLAKVATRAGFRVEDFQFCDSVPPTPKRLLGRARRALIEPVRRRFPVFKTHLVMRVSFN
jgi:hypothetical protein